MLQIIRNLLVQKVNDIDAGNSIISEAEEQKILNILQEINQEELSKIQSYNYIGVSRATFDNYVEKGLIPKGKKKQGWNELSWTKRDLEEFKRKRKNEII